MSDASMNDTERKRSDAEIIDQAFGDDDQRRPAEAAAGAAEDQATGSATETVEERLAALEAEKEKLRDQALRAMAELENTRRRLEKQKEDASRFAITNFARDLLSVADNLGRALGAVPAEATHGDDPGAQAIGALVEGVAATERELLSALEKHGVSRFDPVEQKFDPNFHQAMFEVPDPDRTPGTVVQVIQTGYTLNGRVLRPAMVGVAKAPPTPQKVDTTA